MRRWFVVNYHTVDEFGTNYKSSAVLSGDTMTDAIMACMAIKNVVRVFKVEEVDEIL